MITFEKVSLETKPVVKEMFSSHHLPVQEVQYCIKVDDTYIGVIDYTVQGDNAILCNFIIHYDYQSYGYGTNAYFTLEEMMKHRNIKTINVLQENVTIQAINFIEGLGFAEMNGAYTKQL